MENGVVENEMCPVFVATAAGEPHPDPTEVEDLAWVDWTEFREGVLAGTREISPWCRDQVLALPADPLSAPSASGDGLPPAARTD